MLLWKKPDAAFSSNGFGLGSMFIVLNCLLYFTKSLRNPATENLLRSRTFWLVTALFVYYASNFFIFVSYRRLTEIRPQDIGLVWQIHNLIFLVMCVCFSIGFIWQSSPRRSSPTKSASL